jgi:hypothetical protein
MAVKPTFEGVLCASAHFAAAESFKPRFDQRTALTAINETGAVEVVTR